MTSPSMHHIRKKRILWMGLFTTTETGVGWLKLPEGGKIIKCFFVVSFQISINKVLMLSCR